MDRLVLQNKLSGHYVIHSCQDVASIDKAGIPQKRCFYHVRTNQEMKDNIVQKDCQLFIFLQQISISLSGKSFQASASEKTSLPKAKHRKVENRVKHEESPPFLVEEPWARINKEQPWARSFLSPFSSPVHKTPQQMIRSRKDNCRLNLWNSLWWHKNCQMMPLWQELLLWLVRPQKRALWLLRAHPSPQTKLQLRLC